MSVSFNEIDNAIYWVCVNCGATNSSTVAEMEEAYQECIECSALHDIEIDITVKKVGRL